MAWPKSIALTGVNELLWNLNAEVVALKDRSRGGVREAAMLVRRESQKIVPVGKTGNLKASVYVTMSPLGTKGPWAEIGYGASYAIFVHERFDLRHKPGKTARFLYYAMANNHKRIIDIIKNFVVIPRAGGCHHKKTPGGSA